MPKLKNGKTDNSCKLQTHLKALEQKEKTHLKPTCQEIIKLGAESNESETKNKQNYKE